MNKKNIGRNPARRSDSKPVRKPTGQLKPVAKSPAEQALPRPFIAQSISLLAEVLRFERPADGVLSQYFKTHRDLGHTDRGRLAELIYAVLRHLASLRDVVGRSAPPEGHEARYLVLAALVRLQSRNFREIEHLLKGDETDWFGRLKAAGQEKSDSMTSAVRHEWPEWLEAALATMPESERDALAKSLLQPAPLDLRINPLRAKRAEILAQLDKHGIVAVETRIPPGACVSKASRLFSAIPLSRRAIWRCRTKAASYWWPCWRPSVARWCWIFAPALAVKPCLWVHS